MEPVDTWPSPCQEHLPVGEEFDLPVVPLRNRIRQLKPSVTVSVFFFFQNSTLVPEG